MQRLSGRLSGDAAWSGSGGAGISPSRLSADTGQEFCNCTAMSLNCCGDIESFWATRRRLAIPIIRPSAREWPIRCAGAAAGSALKPNRVRAGCPELLPGFDALHKCRTRSVSGIVSRSRIEQPQNAVAGKILHVHRSGQSLSHSNGNRFRQWNMFHHQSVAAGRTHPGARPIVCAAPEYWTCVSLSKQVQPRVESSLPRANERCI